MSCRFVPLRFVSPRLVSFFLFLFVFSRAVQITLSPFNVDAPGGINSMMTSLMKPVLPLIFYAQFMYLYRYSLMFGGRGGGLYIFFVSFLILWPYRVGLSSDHTCMYKVCVPCVPCVKFTLL